MKILVLAQSDLPDMPCAAVQICRPPGELQGHSGGLGMWQSEQKTSRRLLRNAAHGHRGNKVSLLFWAGDPQLNSGLCTSKNVEITALHQEEPM